MILLRILLRIPLIVVLVVPMLAGCYEQTNYRIVGTHEGEYGMCITGTFHTRQYGRGAQLMDSYGPLIEDSYLLLRNGTQIWFSPEPGGNYEVDTEDDDYAWDPEAIGEPKSIYIGGSQIGLPVSTGKSIQVVKMDYPCAIYGEEVPRVYWVTAGGHDALAALSVWTWQYDNHDGVEHAGRIIAFYELDSLDYADDLLFLYRDHIVLYDKHIGAQVGSEREWQEAEERAIRDWLESL